MTNENSNSKNFFYSKRFQILAKNKITFWISNKIFEYTLFLAEYFNCCSINDTFDDYEDLPTQSCSKYYNTNIYMVKNEIKHDILEKNNTNDTNIESIKQYVENNLNIHQQVLEKVNKETYIKNENEDKYLLKSNFELNIENEYEII